MTCLLLAALGLTSCVVVDRVPRSAPVEVPPPRPAIVAQPPARARLAVAGGRLVVASSSAWAGWPAARAIDGDPTTSWFSASGDSAAKGKAPYLEAQLAAPAQLGKVVILGNREPAFPKGYSVKAGRLELFGAGRVVLLAEEGVAQGNHYDFEFRVPPTLGEVHAVRFTSLADEGDQNPYGDVAIGELRVE